jgi:4-amino-4-deoxy-L-arabinose transferase-like glycosyltransferase
VIDDGAGARATRLALAALCALHLLIAGDAATRATPTLDEFAHLPAALSFLETGSFRMYPHNPPLPRLVAALAARPLGLRLVYDYAWKATPPSHLAFAEEALLVNTATEEGTRRYLLAFTWARWLMAAWSASTIPVLFLWGRRWFGPWAGWTAAALWALCPNVLAHGGLITGDVPAAGLGVWTGYLTARWLESAGTRASGRRAALAGLALGLALLTKFSVLALIPILVGWAAVSIGCRKQAPAGAARATAVQLAGLLLLALLVLNAGYLFEGTGRPLRDLPFASQALTRPRLPGEAAGPERVNRLAGTILGRLPSPVPSSYLLGIDALKGEGEGKYELYLRGVWQRGGYWDYYLYGLLVKWPLSTWVVLLLAGGLLLSRPTGRGQALVWLLLAALPLVLLSAARDLNLGLRYALPAFPFLFLLAGCAAGDDRPRWARRLVALALLWNAACVARIHPHELAYFNEAAGGPAGGRFHLIDSNLDWGQDLTRLAAWVRRTPDWSDVRLAYWGAIPPEIVGLRHRLAPRDLRQVPAQARLPGEDVDDPRTWGPLPGHYAISVNFERGYAFRTPCPRDLALPPDSAARFNYAMLTVPTNAYRYFELLTPRIDPEVGYSILLYDVSLEDANRVRRQLGLPELR